jgi:hypothetical protein
MDALEQVGSEAPGTPAVNFISTGWGQNPALMYPLRYRVHTTPGTNELDLHFYGVRTQYGT